MNRFPGWTLLAGAFIALLAVPGMNAPLRAQEPLPIPLPPPTPAHPSVVRLSLDEAKQRVLANNKLLHLASLNVEGKAFAIKAARADYFPKVVGSSVYLHFQDDLGRVITTRGRNIGGPRGRTLLSIPAVSVEAAFLNQNSSFTNIGAVQPLTDLLKVRQGVKLAQADAGIAQAQLEKGIRELVSGTQQLYWGLLAAQRLRKGAVEGVQGAELLAKLGTLEARIALMEARQGLQQVDAQVADLQVQLNGLLDLPACTILELVEPPLPLVQFRCADEVIDLALSASPELSEASHTIAKAHAAVTAGKLDFVPSVAVVGGYLNQTGASYVQQDIGYVGVVGSYTFVDWGKRRNIVNERNNLMAMANLKFQQTQDDVRQKAVKYLRELAETQATLQLAQEMVELRRQVEKKATTPALLIPAARARMLAEVDVVKAELAHRQAYVNLMTLLGKQ